MATTARTDQQPTTRAPGVFLVWGPPSHGPRSRVLAAALGLEPWFVHRVRRRGLLAAPAKYTYQAVATAWRLVRRRPRVVFVQSPPSFAAWLVAAHAALTGAHFVVDAHSDAMLTPWWTRPHWLNRLISRRAAATLVTNEHFAARLRGWGADAIVLPDVPTAFCPGPAPVRDDRFLLTVVNTFAPDEPLEEIVEAARGLPDVDVRITGSLRRAPGRVPADVPANVTFTDFLPDSDYYGLLAASDAVLCLTTRDHTMQRGACEALSLGTPIVTSRWPLLQEYFDEGTVHVTNDADGIRDGVLRLRDDLTGYRAGVERLRSRRRAEWRVASAALRALVEGSAPPR
ncbi:glycosyltransferase [Egicoccus sp. AB-alg2]|uniref:glycosyltransferase family protein n=1 Tax=Egicoccus sp. AB-alg2 TaxID=3242693 RepID=UPI00359CF321